MAVQEESCMNVLDIVGKKFGRLLVIRYYEHRNHRPYYLCLCDCGTHKYVSKYNLTSKRHTKSCGCLVKEKSRETIKKYGLSEKGNAVLRKSVGEASFNRIYYTYKKSARDRKIDWHLTKENVQILTKSICYYCGIKPLQKTNTDNKFNGIYEYNGIDRIDNSKGYIIENCVPCCGVCNRAKYKFSEKEFLEWIDRIYNFQHLTSRIIL